MAAPRGSRSMINAALSLVVIVTAGVLLAIWVDPQAKMHMAVWLVREARAQKAARQARARAHRESKAFQGEIETAIAQFCEDR